jgi:hypothetical protein
MKKSELVTGRVYRVKVAWGGHKEMLCVSIPEDSKNRWANFSTVNQNSEIDKYLSSVNLAQIEREIAPDSKTYLLDKKIADAEYELRKARKAKMETGFKQVAKEMGIEGWHSFAPANWDYPFSRMRVELSLSEWEKVVAVLKKGV